MTRMHFLLFLFASLASFVAGAAPTFCKCTCFTNSTIIPLGPQKDAPAAPQPNPWSGGTSSSSSSSAFTSLPSDAAQTSLTARSPFEPRAASSSCTQCNRKFCLEYNLPICKGAEEKDVMTSCFQRDSRKDQIIVWAFILGTTGLLGWAGLRRLLEMRQGKALPFGVPVGGSAAGGGAARPSLGSPGLVRRVTGLVGGGAATRGAYSPLGTPGEEGDGGRGLR